MRLFFIIGVCLILLNCFQSKGKTMAKDVSKLIELHFSKQTVSLGEEIKFMVIYQNLSGVPLTLRDPSKTWEVMLDVADASGNTIQEIPFGKIIVKTTPEGITSQSAEAANNITIKPKEKIHFVPEIYSRHANTFEPGVYQIKINDYTNDNETVSSNEIKIAVEVTASSFEYLLIICSDEHQSVDNRRFAARWLNELYSEFEYVIENPTEEQKMANTQMVKDSGEWWEAHKYDSEVKQKIAQINRRAGIHH